ncbi:segregation and condensation protein A [Komagataeibacter sp. NFXK3]
MEVGAWQGPLEALLQAVRGRAIDLRTLPLRELIEQFLICVEEGLKNRPLEQTANDLVLAATLLQMRSALLLREDTEEHLAAHSAAEQIQCALLRKNTLLQAVECFETRPVLGENVFGRGKLPPSPSAAETASLILTRDLLDALLSASRRRARLRPPESIFLPSFVSPFSVKDAVTWWQAKGQKSGRNVWKLVDCIKEISAGGSPPNLMQRKMTWAIHFSTVLELDKQGEVYLQQHQPSGEIIISKLELELSM